MMNNAQLRAAAVKVKSLGEEVRKQLGCGFPETIYQNALAIEFRRSGIEYLKEVNVEIFYKGESVGVDRPDFLITKIGSARTSIILEIKVADKISADHCLQLKSYVLSLPKNHNPVLKGCAGAILLAFAKCDTDTVSPAKVFVVNTRWTIVLDEQAEEDLRLGAEKSQLQQEKKGSKKKT